MPGSREKAWIILLKTVVSECLSEESPQINNYPVKLSKERLNSTSPYWSLIMCFILLKVPRRVTLMLDNLRTICLHYKNKFLMGHGDKGKREVCQGGKH